MARRATPITSGLIAVSRTSNVVAVPVVPHEMAASAIRSEPAQRRAGLTGRTQPVMIAPPSLRKEFRMKIGFIGTGTMGRPMLANLVKKGFAVTAYDVVPAALEGAVKAGRQGRRARRRTRRARADLVVTMLPSSSHVESVYLGSGGVLEGVGVREALRRHVDDRSRGLAPRGRGAARRRASASSTRRCPAACRSAIDGTLAIMIGGDARDVEEARPALAAMGANIIHVGPVGAGEVAKLCNNLIAGVAAVAVSEAFRIAEGFGVDHKVLTDVISKSSGNTWVMEAAHPGARHGAVAPRRAATTSPAS